MYPSSDHLEPETCSRWSIVIRYEKPRYPAGAVVAREGG
eukprot:SAG31_NODE_48322_length_194_cov_33.736842_1_plen_38_part_01